MLIDALLRTNETIVSAAEKQGDNESDKENDHDEATAANGKFVHKIDNVEVDGVILNAMLKMAARIA